MIVVLALLIIAFGFPIFLVLRDKRVYNYRMKLLSIIHDRSKIDIQENRPWKWRYEAYNSVSYDNMLFRFWKPLESFYKDKSFLE